MQGEETLVSPRKFVYDSLRRNPKYLDKEIRGDEKKLLSLVKQDQQVQLALLTSISGIRIRIAFFNYWF